MPSESALTPVSRQVGVSPDDFVFHWHSKAAEAWHSVSAFISTPDLHNVGIIQWPITYNPDKIFTCLLWHKNEKNSSVLKKEKIGIIKNFAEGIIILRLENAAEEKIQLFNPLNKKIGRSLKLRRQPFLFLWQLFIFMVQWRKINDFLNRASKISNISLWSCRWDGLGVAV